MNIDKNTKAFRLVQHKARFLVYQVSENGAEMQLCNKNGQPVVTMGATDLRRKLGLLASKGIIDETAYNLPIGV